MSRVKTTWLKSKGKADNRIYSQAIQILTLSDGDLIITVINIAKKLVYNMRIFRKLESEKRKLKKAVTERNWEFKTWVSMQVGDKERIISTLEYRSEENTRSEPWTHNTYEEEKNRRVTQAMMKRWRLRRRDGECSQRNEWRDNEHRFSKSKIKLSLVMAPPRSRTVTATATTNPTKDRFKENHMWTHHSNSWKWKAERRLLKAAKAGMREGLLSKEQDR